jgi:hypothetical protein
MDTFELRTRRSLVAWPSLAALLAIVAVAAACGDTGENTGGSTSSCPEGVICSGGGGDPIGANGNDGGGTAQGANGQGGAGACIEAWQCTPWQSEPEGSDNGVRTCTDANDCGTTAQKPVEMAVLPALDVDYYECAIEPILNRTCSMMGCHGSDKRGLRNYSRGRFRNVAESVVNPCPGGGMTPLDQCLGSIECGCWQSPHTATEWQRNYDSARGMALDIDGSVLADMTNSELIQQPFEEGGKAHAGIKQYKMADPEYGKFIAWLEDTATWNRGNGNSICETNN